MTRTAQVALLLISACVSGCVSQKAVLVNADGQVMNCNQWGFGVLGAPISMAQHEECLKAARAAGYAETQALARKKFQAKALECSTIEKDGKLDSSCK